MNKLAWVESAPVPQLIVEKSAYFLGFCGTMSNGSVPIKEGSVFIYRCIHTFLEVMVLTETVPASDNGSGSASECLII